MFGWLWKYFSFCPSVYTKVCKNQKICQLRLSQLQWNTDVNTIISCSVHLQPGQGLACSIGCKDNVFSQCRPWMLLVKNPYSCTSRQQQRFCTINCANMQNLLPFLSFSVSILFCHSLRKCLCFYCVWRDMQVTHYPCRLGVLMWAFSIVSSASWPQRII